MCGRRWLKAAVSLLTAVARAIRGFESLPSPPNIANYFPSVEKNQYDKTGAVVPVFRSRMTATTN